MSPKAFVTGATGFIGSHLVETLVAQNWEVTCLVRPTSRLEFLKKFLVLFVESQPEEIIYFSAWLTDVFKKAGIIKSYFGRKVWRAVNQTSWLFLSSKAERHFGFRPGFSLEEGIKKTVSSYRDSIKF